MRQALTFSFYARTKQSNNPAAYHLTNVKSPIVHAKPSPFPLFKTTTIFIVQTHTHTQTFK